MHAHINGIKIGYDNEGRGSALLFIHGFPFDRRVWQRQVAALRATHRVTTVDLRGFGESAAGPGITTMEDLAGDLHAVVEELQTGPVVLVGHSMGGYVALTFARQFPEELRGLVLVGTKAGPDTPEAAAARRATAAKVKANGPQVVIEAMTPKMLAPVNQTPPQLAQVRGFMAAATPAGIVGALLGMAERPDSTAWLPTITVPTLIVTGADDVLIPPAESEKMAAAIDGARLEIIPNAGHLVAFEQADTFNQVLLSWLSRLGL